MVRDGGDFLPGLVRVCAGERVDTAQRARAGFEDRGRTWSPGARDDVAVGVGPTLACTHLDKGVVAELIAGRAIHDL